MGAHGAERGWSHPARVRSHSDHLVSASLEDPAIQGFAIDDLGRATVGSSTAPPPRNGPRTSQFRRRSPAARRPRRPVVTPRGVVGPDDLAGRRQRAGRARCRRRGMSSRLDEKEGARSLALRPRTQDDRPTADPRSDRDRALCPRAVGVLLAAIAAVVAPKPRPQAGVDEARAACEPFRPASGCVVYVQRERQERVESAEREDRVDAIGSGDHGQADRLNERPAMRAHRGGDARGVDEHRLTEVNDQHFGRARDGVSDGCLHLRFGGEIEFAGDADRACGAP